MLSKMIKKGQKLALRTPDGHVVQLTFKDMDTEQIKVDIEADKKVTILTEDITLERRRG